MLSLYGSKYITALIFSSITNFNLKKKNGVPLFTKNSNFPFASQVTVSVCKQNVRARHSR